MFRRMDEAGHRFSYTDFLSGNASLPAGLFERVGGFNGALIRHHDYELGYRLLAAGAEFRFSRTAATIHHERSDLQRTLLGKTAEGHDDVVLGRLYPVLRPYLPMPGLRKHQAAPSRLMMHLAFGFPMLGERLAQVCEGVLGTLERSRRYATWMRIVSGLMIYRYWRGVAQELTSIGALNEFLSSPGESPDPGPAVAIDLRRGAKDAAAVLDETQPSAVVLYWGERLIGRIPALPGVERLKGGHLAVLLWRQFRAPLLHALAADRATGIPGLDEHLRRLAAERLELWEEPEWRV